MDNKKEKASTCQNCKSHKNNPSKCKTFDKFVGRKSEICTVFKRK